MVARNLCYWYCSINDDLLFILPNKTVISYNTKEPLIHIKYRGRPYVRYKNTHKRVAISSIKRIAQQCNVIL